MLRHLCSTSVHLPELPLDETAAKQLAATLSRGTMQDVSCCSGLLLLTGHHAGRQLSAAVPVFCRDV
jgi:hypothetical protein